MTWKDLQTCREQGGTGTITQARNLTSAQASLHTSTTDHVYCIRTVYTSNLSFFITTHRNVFRKTFTVVNSQVVSVSRVVYIACNIYSSKSFILNIISIHTYLLLSYKA